jgi:hypothetical protein
MQPQINKGLSHGKPPESELLPAVKGGPQAAEKVAQIPSEIRPPVPAAASSSNMPQVSVNPPNLSSAKVNVLVKGKKPKENEKPGMFDRFVAKVVTKAIDFATGDNDLSKINEESRARITKLTGNPKLGLTLEAAAPKFGEVVLSLIKNKLSEGGYGLGLQAALSKEQDLITDCLNATILRMAANLAERATIENRLKPGEFVGFPDLIALLLKTSGDRLFNIHHQIAAVEAIQDPKERALRMKELLEPFKTDLLSLLLPNGIEDIAIPGGWLVKKGKDKIYALISDSFPELIIKYYHQVMDPVKESAESNSIEKLNALPSGNVLNAMADALAKKLPAAAPGLIESNVAGIVAELQSQLFTGKEASLDKEWLSNGIIQVAQSNKVGSLWSFSEFYLGPVIRKLFLNMATHCKDVDPTSVMKGISTYLLKSFDSFFAANKDKINGILLELKNENSAAKKIELEWEASNLFKPLRDDLFKMIGFDNPENLPIPVFLRKVIIDELNIQLPKQLLKLYQDYAGMDQAIPIDDPNANMFTKFANVLTTNISSVLIDKISAEAPAAIAKAIEAPANQAVVQSELIATVINSLIDNPIAKKGGDIIRNQVQVVLNKILVKIATHGRPEHINRDVQSQDDLFSNLVIQVVNLCKSHLGNMPPDISERISKYRTLPDAEKEIERESLIKAFIPMGNKLLELAGFSSANAMPAPQQLKSALYNLLKESVLPCFSFDTYLGVTADSIQLQQVERDLTPNEFAAVKDAGGTLAEKAVEELKKALGENSSDRVENINKLLPAQELPEDLQVWLSEQLKKVVQMQSPAVTDGFAFIEKYIQNLLTTMMGKLVIQYNQDHQLVEEDLLDENVLKNAILQLVTLTMNSLNVLENDYLTEINALSALPEDQVAEKEKALMHKLEPVILRMLTGVGLSGPDALAVPDSIKAAVWNLLTKTSLPQFLFKQVRSLAALQPELSENAENLTNVNRLNSVLGVIGNNVIPIAQKSIQENRESYTAKIVEAVNKVIPGLIDQDTVGGLLQEVVDPQEAGTRKLVKELPRFLLNFIKPMLVNIAAADGEEGDVLERMVVKLLSLVKSNFSGEIPLLEDQMLSEDESEEDIPDLFNQEISSVDELELSDMDELSPGDQKLRLEGAFGSFVDEVLEAAGLDPEKIPGFVREQALEQVFMLYKTVKTPLDMQELCRLDLNTLLGIDLESLQNSLDEYSEAEEAAASPPMEEIIAFVSDKIQTQIKDYLTQHADLFPKMINDLLPEKKLSERNQLWLTNSIKKIVTSEDEGIKDLWEYSSNVIQTALMKLFVDVAGQLPEADDPEVAKETLIPALFAKITDILGENLQGIEARVIEINRLEPEERKIQLRALFKPLADAFLEMVGENPLDALPIPPALKGTLLEKLQSEILPDFLASAYNDIASWAIEKKGNKHQIMEMYVNYRPSVPMAAARVVARFASDFIPVLLNNRANKAAEKMQAAVTSFMSKQTGENAEAIQAYIEGNSDQINAWMQANLSGLVDGDLDLIDVALPAAEKYIEAGVLKIMKNILVKVEQKQQDPEFLVDLGIEMINVANKHFTEIIRVMKIDNRDLASEVDPVGMAAAYQDFHKALDPAVTDPEEKENLIKDKFYIPFTKQLLQLAGVTQDSLPVPAALRQELFELVKSELGPVMMKSMLEAIDIDQIMLKVLEAVNVKRKPKNAVQVDDVVLTEEEIAKQAEIDNACGDLFLNAIRLLPNKMIRTFFSNKKIKNLSAQALGKVLREELGNMNLLNVVNDALARGLPSLNEQITVDEEGNLVVPPNLHFVLPATPKESEARDVLKAQEKIDMNVKLTKELAKTIGYQVKSRIENFFTAPWKAFQEKLDAWILKKMGPKGMKIKRKLDKFFHAVVFSTTAALLYVLLIPLTLILRKVFQKKAKEIVSLLHMDIHKNLVFKMADTFMERMNEG